MKGCAICNVKHVGFYVSSDHFYLCPNHRKTLLENDENEAMKFKKNRFIVDGAVAKMFFYNHSFQEKGYILVDSEDISLIDNMRWHESNEGAIITIAIRNGKKVTLKLIDYLMYMRFGVVSPSYHISYNQYDYRKVNMRIKKDQRRKRSTVRNIL